jgi:glutamate mutase epsilon subunit
MLGNQKLVPLPEIAEGQAILAAETRAIVDRALDLGDGDAPTAGRPARAPWELLLADVDALSGGVLPRD